jgi:hypothetical protein
MTTAKGVIVFEASAFFWASKAVMNVNLILNTWKEESYHL